MAETDTGVAQGGLGKTIGDAVIAFNHTNVMLPLVTSKQAVKGAITVQFPDYTKVASSSVAAATDGGDHTTVASITTAARSATVSEHVIRADVSDLARMGNAEDLTGNDGAVLGDEVAAKLDAAPAGTAAQVGTPEARVNTWSSSPLPNLVTVPDEPPYITSPSALIGERASNPAVAVLAPVPPWATATSVASHTPVPIVPPEVI